MKPRQCVPVCATLLLLLSITGSANGGNILVWFTEGSHWINLKPVLDTLIDRGHRVTVLVPSTSMFMDANEPSRFHYEPFNVSVSMEAMEEFFEEWLQFSIYEMDHLNLLQIHIRFLELMKRDMKFSMQYLDGVLKSDIIMGKLREAEYDLMLADPIFPGSDMVAELLAIPLVYTLRFSIAHTWERLCGQLPAPPSYVPGPMIKLTDNMSFSERVWNFLFYASQDMLFYHLWQDIDKYYTEVKGERLGCLGNGA